ncbi:MAG: type II toxin-antitoxin system VapC family toxin [Amaricoccus sp.]|uniref:type II toxin-antitoxin system VapC family toxin n=1 Tax=Amaricoccus sp. TaxID=1872485 RepID=UPI0039E5787C
MPCPRGPAPCGAGADTLALALGRAADAAVPAPCYLETCMLLTGRGGVDGRPVVDDLLETFGVRILPLTDTHARLAVDAFLRYGKGRHPAALNFGDCISYAVARAETRPLLFAGTDFCQTDVAQAI